jgi:hypothetical protein
MTRIFVALDWYQAKTFIEHAIGFSHDALHVFVGVVIQLGIAALLRRSLQSIWPWLIVLALELGNEWVDLSIERWPVPAEQFGEGAKDILLTIALPTLLLLVARFRPRWLVSR